MLTPKVSVVIGTGPFTFPHGLKSLGLIGVLKWPLCGDHYWAAEFSWSLDTCPYLLHLGSCICLEFKYCIRGGSKLSIALGQGLVGGIHCLTHKSTEIIATWFKKEISVNICHVPFLYYKIISQNCALNSLEPKESDFYTVGGGISK